MKDEGEHAQGRRMAGVAEHSPDALQQSGV